MDEQVQETLKALNSTRNVCRLIEVVCWVILSAAITWWLWPVGFYAEQLIQGGMNAPDSFLLFLAIVLFIAFAGCLFSFIFLLIRIFRDIVKGIPPFVFKQVRRIRLMALSLASYSLLELCISTLLLAIKSTIGPNSTEASILYFGLTDGVHPTLDLFPILMAAVLFALSFVFKYGVLLQQLSDETL